MNKYKKGDIVVLKSGGPYMKVKEVHYFNGGYNGGYRYKCSWKTRLNGTLSDVFAEEALTPTENYNLLKQQN